MSNAKVVYKIYNTYKIYIVYNSIEYIYIDVYYIYICICIYIYTSIYYTQPNFLGSKFTECLLNPDFGS